MTQLFNPGAEFMVVATQELVTRFTALDYLVVISMILISGTIGLYAAFNDGPQNTIRQLLAADGKLPPALVSTSLMASFICASYVLGKWLVRSRGSRIPKPISAGCPLELEL